VHSGGGASWRTVCSLRMENPVMEHIVRFTAEDIIPAEEDVLRDQGIPRNAAVHDRVQAALESALSIFSESAQPQGLIEDLPAREFEAVFRGENSNADDALLRRIFPHAEHLALFVLTLGGAVSRKIEEYFEENNFAQGALLDSAASLAADRAVDLCEMYYADYLTDGQPAAAGACVLSYSPGYCGWHISGQGKLFERLRPERIGVTLNDSFLMTPLKSVSGVLVAGKKEIHIFYEGAFSYCGVCKNHTCRERMNRLTNT